MSNKAVIESIRVAISSATRGLERDFSEVSQLQRSDKSSNFTIAAYKACLRRLVGNLSSISKLYKVQMPSFVQFILPNGALLRQIDVVGEKFNSTTNDGTGIEDSSNTGSFIVNAVSGLGLFGRSVPFYSVSVGIQSCIDHDSDLLGITNSVVYECVSATFYSATLKGGAYMYNGYNFKISVSSCTSISAASVFTCVGEELRVNSANLRANEKKLSLLKKMSNLLVYARNYISMPNPELGIIYVASGKIDLFCYCGDIDINSLLPSLLIAKEAGAVFFDTDGNEVEMDVIGVKDGLFVSSASMSRAVVKLLQNSGSS